MKLKDLTGQKFNMLLVLKRVPDKIQGKPRYLCKCDCGKEKEIQGSNLTRKITRSCGCLVKERMAKFSKGNRYKQLPKGESGFKYVYRFYERNADKKNLEFSIEPDDFRKLVTSNCYYCGCEPSNKSTKNHTEWSVFYYNGLDRIDPNKGYTIDNVLPCCKRDNYIRNKFLTVEETKVMVEALENYRKNK